MKIEFIQIAMFHQKPIYYVGYTSRTYNVAFLYEGVMYVGTDPGRYSLVLRPSILLPRPPAELAS
jgi:hypothetical protein